MMKLLAWLFRCDPVAGKVAEYLRDCDARGVPAETIVIEVRYRRALVRVRRAASDAVLRGEDAYAAISAAVVDEAKGFVVRSNGRKFIDICSGLNALDILYPDAYVVHDQRYKNRPARQVPDDFMGALTVSS